MSESDQYTNQAGSESMDQAMRELGFLGKEESKPAESKNNKKINAIREKIKDFGENTGRADTISARRTAYAQAYNAYIKSEYNKKGKIGKVKSKVSSLLVKEMDVESLSDGSQENKDLKYSKQEYDEVKWELINEVKQDLKVDGHTDDQISEALIQEMICEEYDRFREARITEKSKDKKIGLIKKSLVRWRSLPWYKKAAVSAVVGTGAFVVGAGLGVIGVAVSTHSLAIFAGRRFFTAVAVNLGMTTAGHQLITGAVHFIDKKTSSGLPVNLPTTLEEFQNASKLYGKQAAKKLNIERTVALGAGLALGFAMGFGASRTASAAIEHIPGAGSGGASTGGAGSSASESPSSSTPKDSFGAASKSAAEGGGKSGSTGETGGKKVNYTDLTGKQGGLRLWEKWTNTKADPQAIKALLGFDENSAENRKIVDYFSKKYISEEEMTNLKAHPPTSVADIDKQLLYHPKSINELNQFLSEKHPSALDGAKNNNSFFSVDAKGTITRDGYTGSFFIDEDTGDLLYTGGGNITNASDVSIGWLRKDGEFTAVLDKTERPPTYEELKLIRSAYETSGNNFTDGQKALLASQLKSGETLEKADIDQVVKITASSSPDSTSLLQANKIELSIGSRGPEGAMIDWLEDNPDKAGKIAKALGVTDEKNYGAIAHKSWLKSMEDPVIRKQLEVAGLYQYKDTMAGDLAGMKRIVQGGKIVVDPDTGKMSFSDDTVFLKPRITHTPIVHSSSPSATSVVVNPATSTIPTDALPPVGAPPTISETQPFVSRADTVLAQANVPQASWSGMKETFVKNIVEKGTQSPGSPEGAMLSYLYKFYNEPRLQQQFYAYKKLKDLLESMEDVKPI